MSTALRDEDFAHMIPLATAWTDGVQATIDRHDLPWHVQQLGCRAEYWFCPPPRDGAAAAAAVDDELDAFMHLWALNRGILLTPFHNMALMSPHHDAADVDAAHRGVRDAVEALVSVRRRMKLDDQVAIVTGAGSADGIGFACAKALAADGATW